MLGSPLVRPASPRKLRVLTNSELKTLRRCAFEHRLAYGLGYRSVREADALRFGTVIHVTLEA
jgi:PD-(D/E)XK nuclease superfamily